MPRPLKLVIDGEIVEVPEEYHNPFTIQPGDALARVIAQVVPTAPRVCKCAIRQRQMNQWGWLGCWKHRNTIAQWIKEEAARLGYDVREDKVSSLLVTALNKLKLRGTK